MSTDTATDAPARPVTAETGEETSIPAEWVDPFTDPAYATLKAACRTVPESELTTMTERWFAEAQQRTFHPEPEGITT